MAGGIVSTGAPWWFSGDASGDRPSDDAGDRATRGRFDIPGLDLAGLASGAQQLVELARQALLAPHAGHEDPRAHPDCVICRTMAAVGEVRTGTDTAERVSGIAWIALEPPRR
jgi:hypothetical protein